jgi:hypothetical protein
MVNLSKIIGMISASHRRLANPHILLKLTHSRWRSHLFKRFLSKLWTRSLSLRWFLFFSNCVCRQVCMILLNSLSVLGLWLIGLNRCYLFKNLRLTLVCIWLFFTKAIFFILLLYQIFGVLMSLSVRERNRILNWALIRGLVGRQYSWWVIIGWNYLILKFSVSLWLLSRRLKKVSLIVNWIIQWFFTFIYRIILELLILL